MRRKQYYKGICFNDNSVYLAKENRYDFFLDEAQEIEDDEIIVDANVKSAKVKVAHYLVGLENVVIDFGGATLVFHGRIIPFVLKKCKNVSLVNFKVDYDRPFYTQANVINVKKGTIEAKIENGFDYEVNNGCLIAMGEGWEKNLNRDDCLLWMYDKTKQKKYEIMLGLFGNEIYPSKNPPLPIKQLQIEEKNKKIIIKGDFPDTWDTNDGNNILIITHELRDKATITLIDCDNTIIKNVTVIYGASMALIAMNSSNIEIESFNFYQNYNGNGRYVSNNADGIHTYNCSGKIVVKNCYMEGLLDDYINIHNNYVVVDSIVQDKVLIKSPGAAIGIQCPVIAEGQSLLAYNQNTVEPKETYTILNLEVDKKNQVYVVKFDKDLDKLAKGDVLENISSQPEIEIKDCYFGNIRGLARFQSRGKTIIENCTFDNPDIALIFTGDMTYWFESGPVQNFIVRGCKFYWSDTFPRFDFRCDVGFTDEENYYHKNILIENCEFLGCGKNESTLAKLRHVDNFIFRNNSYDGEVNIKIKDCGAVEADCKIINEE